MLFDVYQRVMSNENPQKNSRSSQVISRRILQILVVEQLADGNFFTSWCWNVLDLPLT